MKKWTNSLF